EPPEFGYQQLARPRRQVIAGIGPVAPARTLVLHAPGGDDSHRRRMVHVSPKDDALMRLTFDSYWPLLFLLIVPYLWWVRRQSAVDLSPRHLRLSTIVRSVIVCALTVALMQPILYKTSTYVSVVYLLDVSQSVAP